MNYQRKNLLRLMLLEMLGSPIASDLDPPAWLLLNLCLQAHGEWIGICE